MTPKETLNQAMADLGVTVAAVFVPWSESRNFKPGARVTARSLNWRVTLKHNEREILTTEYSAGIGHAPSYKAGVRMSLDGEAALIHETEKGTQAKPSAYLGHVFSGKPITCDPCDVVHALVSDSSVIDHPDFESWASDLGYDADSRSAERTYQACLGIALKLRAAIGDAGLAKLRNACEGY